MLDFSRLERGRGLELVREERALTGLAEGLAHEARQWAERHGFELAVATADLSGSAEVDRDALARVVLNLLENARLHSGTRQATLSLGRRGGELLVAVQDRGRGIPEAQRESVFMPYERGARGAGSGTGTGLGLALVREIAQLHGGSAVLAAPPAAGGTRVEVRLPTLAPGSEAARPEEVTR